MKIKLIFLAVALFLCGCSDRSSDTKKNDDTIDVADTEEVNDTESDEAEADADEQDDEAEIEKFKIGRAHV